MTGSETQHDGRPCRWAPTAMVLVLLLTACADEETSPPEPIGQGAGGEGGGGQRVCDPGQVVGPGDACMAVGIQGCAAVFIEEDNLCHPSMDKCPAGTIPKFDEGCVSVGIQGCPEVFMEDDGLCHPAMSKCPEGSFAAPLLGCVPIDGDEGCGTGTWGHIADGPDTVWVDPVYAGGDGDGSQAHPLTTIAAALAAVPDGGRIALAAGQYDEPAHLTRPVEIVGRCPSLVTISGTLQPSGWTLPGIVVAEHVDGATLRGLRLTGAGCGVAALGGRVRLEGVHVQQSTRAGVLAFEGAEVSIERSLVDATVPDQEAGDGGGLVLLDQGTTVTVRDSALVDSPNGGAVAYGFDALGEDQTVTLVLDGCLVEGSRHVGGFLEGAGVNAFGGAEVTISASAFVRNGDGGIDAMSGGTITAERSLVEASLGTMAGRWGNGILVRDDGSASLISNAIVGNRRAALEVHDRGMAEVRGNLFRDTVEDYTAPGHGCYVVSDSAALLADNAIVSNAGAGVVVQFAQDGARIEGNLIERNGSPDDVGPFVTAEGLMLRSTQANVSSNAIVDNTGMGLMVAAASAVVADNLVEGSTRSDVQGYRRGQGIYVLEPDTTVSLRGNAVLGNTAIGVWVTNGAAIDGERLLVAGTQPHPPDGEYGVGLQLLGGASAELSQVVARANHLAAVLVQGSTLRLSQSELSGTVPGGFTVLSCPAPPCPWNTQQSHQDIADGLIAVGSEVSLVDVDVAGCDRAGLIYHASSGELRQVESVNNGLGLVLQSSPRPALGEGCVFEPNRDQDVLEDGDVAVPNEASELPEGPGR